MCSPFSNEAPVLTYAVKTVSFCDMRILFSNRPGILFGLILVLSLCPSCKPKNEASQTSTEQSSPPSTVSAPATNESAPNPPTPGEAPILTPEEARNHIGEMATVKGKVERVYVSQKGDVFIDMGGKHPNAPFTAVCFKQAIPTDQLQALDGKVISVKGKIKEYQGKVEIVLETANQISQ